MSTENNEREEFVDLLNTDPQPKEETQPKEEVVQETPKQEEEIPDKYKDKDIKEIIRMHQEAEKLLGRQSNEVGELRKTFDEFIKSQTVEPKNSGTQEEDFDSTYWENPKEAVTKAIENHPSVKEAKVLQQNLRKQEALATLKSKHPDFNEIVADTGFQEWVGKSKVRTELLRKADQQFDAESALELFDLWKERKDFVNQAKQESKERTKEMVSQANTGNVTGSAEPRSRKIFRRADIMTLMKKDPTRYKALLPEIKQAYVEGRVK